MWTCPNCTRKFKNTNQHHTCQLVEVTHIFKNRPPILKELYEKILEVANTFGEYRIESIPYEAIRLKTQSTFVSIKRKKDHLAISFYLDKLEDVPPVVKYRQMSKNRVVHVVPIDALEDIDDQLVDWMRRSYELVTK